MLQSELPSTHSLVKEWEEPTNDEDELQHSKQRRHNKGDSASGSSPAKRVADPEVTDTGSSSPSGKESTEPQDPLIVDTLALHRPWILAGFLPSPLVVRMTKN